MEIERLRGAVFAKQKILAQIYRASGRLALADYVKSWRVAAAGDSVDQRSFFGQINKMAGRLHGPDIAAGVSAQLAAWPLASTVDHHRVFGHPFFLNANLTCSLYPGQEFLVALPTAGVSLNNNTSWSGCLLLTGDDGRPRRLSFFPDRLKTRTVLSAPLITEADARRVVAQLKAADLLAPDKTERLLGLVEQIFLDPRLLALPDFSSQAAAASRRLWRAVFPDAPELIYLPLETLISRQLTEAIIGDSQHVLHRLFFTVAGWQKIEQYFAGSLGAFSGALKGSFLFWGLNDNGRRVRLLREGEWLTGGEFKIEANPFAIAEGLRTGRLYPTSLVCFLVLLSCNLTCVGGFNQVNWLADIQQKFTGLLRDRGERDWAGRIAAAVTDNFAEANLAFGLDRQGNVCQPTALDLFLAGGADAYRRCHKLARVLTVAGSLDSQLPEIYKVITPAPLRDPALLAASAAAVMAGSGMADLLRGHLARPGR